MYVLYNTTHVHIAHMPMNMCTICTEEKFELLEGCVMINFTACAHPSLDKYFI